jgi:D-glycero-D-manno-heptose 1,7-bisphosphate phosphatase
LINPEDSIFLLGLVARLSYIHSPFGVSLASDASSYAGRPIVFHFGPMKRKQTRGTVFLDRDGVINVDRSDYVKSWAEFKFLPQVFEALRLLRKNNLRVVVVTNQSAVGRGLMSIRTLRGIHEKMLRAIEKRGGRIEAIYFCPHRPDESCECRKPKPGLVLRAKKDLKIDLSRSYLVGDSRKDVELARSVRVKCVQIRQNASQKPSSVDGEWTFERPISARTLCEAVDHILHDFY